MSEKGTEKSIVREDGVLVSPNEGTVEFTEPQGSLYKELLKTVKSHLEKVGDWEWLVDGITGEVTLASEIEAGAKKYALVFKQLGFKKGDGLHMVAGNYNNSFLALFGAWILGGYGSCGDVNLDSKAIAGQINDTKVKFVLCLPEYLDTVTEAVKLSDHSDTVQILVFGEAPGYKNLLKLTEEANPDEAPEPVDADDVHKDRVIVFWSSGTTGLPKGICHSHYTSWNAFATMSSEIGSSTNNVTTTCFFHIGGFFVALRSIQNREGYYHMFGKDFTLDILLKAIKKAQPTSVMLGAHHYVQLSEYDIFKTVTPEEVACVENIFPAGSAVPAICEVKLRKMFPGLKHVYNGYGQTESGMVSMGKENCNLGTIVSGSSVKVINPDTGKICKANEEGELCLKTPCMMLEYLARPEATKDFFTEDGYGRSGDLGFYDEEGRLFYVDRMKELIKYRNNHVAPTEIEAILQTHPGVKESLVFGKKDYKVQELISAVIVLNEGSNVSADELREYVNDQVIDYKKIRGDIFFREEIPHNSVGKLLRRQMRAWAESQAS